MKSITYSQKNIRILLAFLAFTVAILVMSSIWSARTQAAPSAATPCVGSAAPAQWKHVVVLMFENKTYNQVIGSTSAPYITDLANKCGTSTTWNDADYYVNGTKYGYNSSKPNYATLLSGVSPTVHKITSNTYATTTPVDNLYNLLRQAGKTGKDYISANPSATPCAGSNFDGAYHDAIRYFSNIDAAYCNSHDVPMSTFMTDVNNGNLPEFSLIIPTNGQNMHDNSVASGDLWAKNFLTPLFDSAQYKSGDTAVFFLWDEDTVVPNVLIAPSIKPGSKVIKPTTGNPISHYSATRTWSEMLGVKLLGDTEQAPSLLSFFNGGGTQPPPLDNAPSVNITAPINGATITTSSVNVTANASDDVGVTKVEFYDGSTLLSTDAVAPFSFSWNVSAISGGHTITAKAFDTVGHTTTSSAVTVSIVPSTTCQNKPSATAGTATIVVNAPAGGIYHLWSRMMAPDTTNNSYYIQIDASCPIIVGDSSSLTPNTWAWLDYQDGNTSSHTLTANLSAGSHTITMIEREGAVKLDRVLLISGSCVPTGTGENCADTTAPSVSLTSPTAAQIVSGSLAIKATASDNSGGSGISKVEFFVDNSSIGSSIVSPYQINWNSTGVADGSHTVKAVATDIAGNTSTSSAVTFSVKNADSVAPTAPTNLKLTSNLYNKVDISWSASTDNIAVTDYRVLRSGIPVATVSGTILTYPDTSVTANTAYIYTIVALDASGNQSPPSVSLSVTTPQSPDTTPPSAPQNLIGTVKSPTQIDLSWTVSTDNVGVQTYYVKRAGVVVGSIPAGAATVFSDVNLAPGKSYVYNVVAADAAGNASPNSNTVTVATPALPDTQAPTAPLSLTADITSNQANLSWAASTDNVSVTGYKIFRNDNQIATSTTLSFGDATVSAGQTYSYYVVATDAAGNASAPSNKETVTVPNPTTAATLYFKPADDAWVKQATPTTNYGAELRFREDGDPVENALLKFNVSGINGRVVTSAKLRIYSLGNSVEGGNFYSVKDNSWGEASVTWNSAPSATSLLRIMGPVYKNYYYFVDLGNYITADGFYSLKVTTKLADGTGYATKENSNTDVWPNLIITVQ